MLHEPKASYGLVTLDSVWKKLAPNEPVAKLLSGHEASATDPPSPRTGAPASRARMRRTTARGPVLACRSPMDYCDCAENSQVVVPVWDLTKASLAVIWKQR